MKKNDLNYVASIGIDIDKIGKFIDKGVHHRVYEFGKNQVIKIPKRRFNFLYSKKTQLLNDYKLLQQYFKNLVVPIKVVASDDRTKHCILQKRVKNFRLLTPKTLVLVEDQFLEILKQNYQLFVSKKYCLDFLGGEGFISCITSLYTTQLPYSSNMVIVKVKNKYKLVLIDSELLRLSVKIKSISEAISFILSIFTMIITVVFMLIFFRVNIFRKSQLTTSLR